MIWDKIEKRHDGELSKLTYTSLFEQGYETNNKKEITFYSCLDILSKSIAKCPLQVKRETKEGEFVEKSHYLYEKLRLRPNPYMSAIDCMKAFVALSIVNGMSGLYINKDKCGRIEGLYPVVISNITIDNMGLIKNNRSNKILYDFHMPCDNNSYSCFEKDIILLKGYTEDGINADSITKILKQNLNTSIKSQEYLNKLFSNGLTNKIAVQLLSDIKEEKELKKIQSKFDRIYSSNGRVFTIPAGYSVNTLDLKLADAQFEQLRRLSKEEIAGALGVPLSKLGFFKENAKSEEQDNLKFYTDTLLVYFEQIEQEMDWKLLTSKERKNRYKVRANTNVLLRTDSKTQAEVINSYVRNGVYDLDMARDILGTKKLGGEPIITLPSGQVLLKDLLAGNVSYLKDKSDSGGGEEYE